MLFHYRIFCASIAIALTRAMVSAVAETNCVDNSSYRSPKLGLACAQHKDLDCREFGVVGYSTDDIEDLLRQCPSSCAVESCTAATEIIDNHQHQQSNDVQVSVQRSRSLRGLLPTSAVSTCPAEWDETCRDDPNFLSKLQLPCSKHLTFDCSVLGAIGFSLQDIVDLISSCPCSCDVECSAPTTPPTTLNPTSHPTIATESPSVSPSDAPTMSPFSSPSLAPTIPSPTLHQKIAPTTSSPANITAPSVENQDIQNAVAMVNTSEEPTQNQNDDSALGFLPFSSSIFYGIIAACVGLVGIVVVTRSCKRRVKASPRRDDNDNDVVVVTSRMKASRRHDDKDDEKRKTTSLKSSYESSSFDPVSFFF